MEPVVVGLVVTWIVLGLACWLGYQLFLQNGRLLLRIEALEQQAGSPDGILSPGLAVGSVTFDFDLPDLFDGRATVSQWRGRRLLLVFVDPRCTYSRALLPALAALPIEPESGSPLPVIVSTGDADENRRLVADHGIRCPVLLQDDAEVASLFHVDGTPMAYLVGEDGRTLAPLAVGAEAVLRLADPLTPVGNDGRPGHAISPFPPRSRLVRDGLPAGTPAPDFRLPRLDGGELALDDLRGRPALLVFSDPTCGPCDLLAPDLERLHRRVSDLQVVMIGRGDPAANRMKAAEHGLTFPIVLQRRWEVSRAYGMFATPIGYLIDAGGTIVSGVAVGGDAILNLAAQTIGGGEARPAG